MAQQQYWGSIDSSKSSILTYDNVNVSNILEDLNQDMAFYDDMKSKFIEALATPINQLEVIHNRYEGEPTPYAEGSKPVTITKQFQWAQQIPFQEYQEQLNITSRAMLAMTAEQVASIVQGKLIALEAKRFSDFRAAAFTNTNRVVLDSTGQYRTTSIPFYNGGGLTELVPVPGYTFQSGDDQHYNGVATANTITAAEVRSLLIDKVRHHGYQIVELHVNEYDYYLEDLTQFVPRNDQIGASLEIQNQGQSSLRGTLAVDSLYNGHVGWVYNSPVIKSKLVPKGYIMAIGISNLPGMMPFYSRQHPFNLNGLQVDVRVEKNPFENTLMSDGWGFAAQNRGGAAFVQVSDTSYSIPSGL